MTCQESPGLHEATNTQLSCITMSTVGEIHFRLTHFHASSFPLEQFTIKVSIKVFCFVNQKKSKTPNEIKYIMIFRRNDAEIRYT